MQLVWRYTHFLKVKLKRKMPLTVLKYTSFGFDGSYNKDFEEGHEFNRIGTTLKGDWIMRDCSGDGAPIFVSNTRLDAFDSELVSLPKGKWSISHEDKES